MLTPAEVQSKYELLRRRNSERDIRWADVRAVRRGHLEEVFEGISSEMFPKPIVANFMDQVARDLTEVMAPLPAFNCSSSTMVTDSARKFADKRTKIANHYIECSAVDVQMMTSVDQYLTYGMMVALVEPDFEDKLPRILFEDPSGAYPEWDRWGRVVSYTKSFLKPGWMLANEFPEYAARLTRDEAGRDIGNNQVELVRYVDKDQWLLFLPGKDHPTILLSTPNKLGAVPVAIARKPHLDQETEKGQWDEIIWIQVARDMMAKLNIEAVYKSVQAPLAVPPDLQDFPLGSDALLRTNNPEKIRRVGIELPQGAVMESQVLNQEMHEGARYPAGRQGNIEASVITGRGVQALMGGFDTQIKTAQTIYVRMFKEVLKLCFLMDEKFWPNAEKQIRGQVAGAAFELKYKPSRDIKGDHTCDVSYGFLAGLDPNRALVMMLQLRGDKEISRDTVQRAMPFGIDVGEEQKKIDVEESRDAIKQGLFQMASSLPMMAQMGQDPGAELGKIAGVIKAIQGGATLEDAVTKVWPAPEPQPQPGPEAAGPQGPPEGAPAGPPGMGGGGGPFAQVAPGQAGMGPGGRPDLQTMLAGLSSSGKPNLQAAVQRRIPA